MNVSVSGQSLEEWGRAMVQAVSPLRPLRMGFVLEKVAQDLVFSPLSL